MNQDIRVHHSVLDLGVQFFQNTLGTGSSPAWRSKDRTTAVSACYFGYEHVGYGCTSLTAIRKTTPEIIDLEEIGGQSSIDCVFCLG